MVLLVLKEVDEATKMTTVAHFQKVAWWPGDQGHTRGHTEDAPWTHRGRTEDAAGKDPPKGTLERLV